jgi:hypothetical protein
VYYFKKNSKKVILCKKCDSSVMHNATFLSCGILKKDFEHICTTTSEKDLLLAHIYKPAFSCLIIWLVMPCLLTYFLYCSVLIPTQISASSDLVLSELNLYW